MPMGSRENVSESFDRPVYSEGGLPRLRWASEVDRLMSIMHTFRCSLSFVALVSHLILLGLDVDTLLLLSLCDWRSISSLSRQRVILLLLQNKRTSPRTTLAMISFWLGS